MITLSDAYLTDLAKLVGAHGAFLGGFAATILVTLLLADTRSRVLSWIIGASALAACSLMVSVISSMMISLVLHPDAPIAMNRTASTDGARVVSVLGFVLGVYALLAAVGLSGWLRSRRLGLLTTTFAVLAIVLGSWALLGF